MMEIRQTDDTFYVGEMELQEFLDSLPDSEQDQLNTCTKEIVDVLFKYPTDIAFFSLIFVFSQSLKREVTNDE